MTEIHLELLLGRSVSEPGGRKAGRIHEIVGERRGDEWVIAEYRIGPTALLSRLSAYHLAAPLFRLLGSDRDKGYRVPWDKMDLSDPDRPRLLCGLEELPRLSAEERPRAEIRG